MKNLTKSLGVITLVTIMVAGVVYAGSLTPPASPISPQSYTLTDLYKKVSNINYSATTHTVSTTSSPSSSFYTLTDIYAKLNTNAGLVIPGNIRSGVTILGVTGTMVEGTPVTYMWEPNATSTRPCWDNDSRNIGNPLLCRQPFGAVEYCRDLVKGGYDDWRLPTRGELIIALQINNESGFFYTTSSNWSSTVDSTDSNKAFVVDIRYSTPSQDKNSAWGVRCIRP